MYRDHTKVIRIGDRKIGGGNLRPDPVHDQYENRRRRCYCCADPVTGDSRRCDIIRCAVPTMEAAKALTRDQETDPYSAGGRHPF